jgi:hypothetical protein
VAVSPVGDITSFSTDTVFESFDVYDTHPFQVIWNELTIIGPAWKESNDWSVNAQPSCSGGGLKRRASQEPVLQPPAHRAASLLHLLNDCVVDSDLKSKEKALVEVVGSTLDTDYEGSEDAHAVAGDSEGEEVAFGRSCF